MTKTSKAAETATEAKKPVARTAEAATETVTNVSNLFSALALSARKTVEGVIEVDKALFGYAKEAVTEYYDLGRESMKAKCLNDLIDLHAGHAHARIEATAANAREVVDLSRTKAKEAYAPVKEAYAPMKDAVTGLMPNKAA